MTQPVDPARSPAPRYPQSGPPSRGYPGWPQHPNTQAPLQGNVPVASPLATQPYEPPHQALPVPHSGRVEVKVNAVQAAVVSVLCLAAAGGFAYWRWYYGDLWDLSDGDGDVNKGTVLFHLIPLILIIVAIVYLVRLFDRSAKLTFEAPGVQIHDKAAPDGYRKVGWGQVGRVMVTKTASGRRTLEHWVVLDRHGAVLANVPAAGNTPSPGTGLAQLVTLTGGRIQIG